MNIKEFEVVETKENKNENYFIYLNMDEFKIVTLAPAEDSDIYTYIYFIQNNDENLKDYFLDYITTGEGYGSLKASFRLLCKISIKEMLDYLQEQQQQDYLKEI